MKHIALATSLAMLALPAAASDLTLHRVMLSEAGVGYFEFDSKIDSNLAGPATLGLDVPLDQVDDVLRSLAVFDDHGGVGSIELPGHDDIRFAFADVPFTQSTLNVPADLLASLRGEQISVSGPDAMTGRIISAAQEYPGSPANGRGSPAGGLPITRVTLLTADGFRQFILERAASIQLTDAVLRARVSAALDASRQPAAAATRHLTLRTSGTGARHVTVGYVVAAPLWKASYRVVLPAATGDRARVQGWAVLENQSGADWKSVDLTLHAGNPVTFHQAIYASYYSNRPEVPVEVLGHLLPNPDERATMASSVAGAAPEFFGPARMVHARRMAEAPPPPPDDIASTTNGGAELEVAAQRELQNRLAEPSTPAEAADTAVDTTFHVATPIDLARGHTASVPIVDQQMPAEQLDLLPADSTRPISALRITNNSATSLPPGVLTLYAQTAPPGAPDTGSEVAFAGDARLSGLPAGESRLLAFAEDLRITAERNTATLPDSLLHVTAAGGVLHEVLRQRVAGTVVLTGAAREPRRVLVEFSKIWGTDSVLDAANLPGIEETASAWRVPISLKPGEVRHLTVNIDRQVASATTLLADNGYFADNVIVQVLAGGTLDPAIRAKLQALADLRRDETTRQAALQNLKDQQSATTADEDRLRNNLRVVQGPGDLHTRLLTALDQDETKLDTLRELIIGVQSDADKAHAALADAVAKLKI
jgi:hypothetical protein